MRKTPNQLRRFTSIVRDRLSVDTWRILNQLHYGVRTPNARGQLDVALALLNRTICGAGGDHVVKGTADVVVSGGES